MKPVFATLRERGHISSGYLDDSLLLSYCECQSNIVDTTTLLKNLGLYPHEDKSVTTPTCTQIIQHLGFVLNCIDITVSLTREK